MDRIPGGLYGASDNDDEGTRVSKAQDFVSRVENGPKDQGYSTEEAVVNYSQATQGLSDDEFQSVAEDALRQLTPEQRREFTHVIKQHTGLNVDDGLDDPRELASLTKQFRAGSGGGSDLSGLLGGLLGGGAGGGSNDIMGMLGGLLGGGGGFPAGGTGSVGAQGTSQAGLSGLLSNPIVKMVLGLIAAQAMKRFMGGGGGGQPKQVARVTPSQGRNQDSGGGLLDSLFGGGDDDRQATRRASDNDGGGLLDSLFGGGDDEPDTDTRRSGSKKVDVSRIERDQKPKGI